MAGHLDEKPKAISQLAKRKNKRKQARSERKERRKAAALAEATEADRKAQVARSKTYGIAIKKGGNVTKPSKFESVPTGSFADPVNFRYPLSPPARASNAITRFNDSANKSAGGYNSREWAIMGKRIARANSGKTFRDGQVVDSKKKAESHKLSFQSQEAIKGLGTKIGYGEYTGKIQSAFHKEFAHSSSGDWVEGVWLNSDHVFEEFVIATIKEQLFKIPYAVDEDFNVTFSKRSEWTKMEQKFVPIREYFKILEARKGKEGKEWEVVIIGPEGPDDIIQEGDEVLIRSKNGRLYSVDALRESVPLWEDAKVYDNHLTDAEFEQRGGMRSVKNEWVGTIVDPSFNEDEYQIEATLKIIDKELREKLKEAHDQDVLHTIGLSIDAFGEGEERVINSLGGERFHVIEKIVKAVSVDIVADPAAGGRLLRMVASTQTQEAYAMTEEEKKALATLVSGAIETALGPVNDRLEAIEEASTKLTEEEELAEAEKIEADKKAEEEAEAKEAKAKADKEAEDKKEADPVEAAIDEAVRKVEEAGQQKLDELADKQALIDSRETLKTTLDDSGLPEDFREIVQAQYVDQVFEADDLKEAIESQKKALTRLSESGNVIIPSGARISGGGVTALDRYTLVFLKMLAGNTKFHEIVRQVKDDPNGDELFAPVRHVEALKRYVEDDRPALPHVPRLGEWYRHLTGDIEGVGGIYPEFQSRRFTEGNISTATVTSIVKNTLNLMLAADYSVRERWWEGIVRQEDVDTLDDATLVRVHGMNNLSQIDEGGTYTELDWEDEEETASYRKRGNFIGISLETFLLDKLNILRTIPMRLSNSWFNTVSALVSNVFTVNSDAGPVLTDTGALFNSTALTTAGGHTNLGTTALSYAEFITARTSMMKQTDQPLGAGRRLVSNRPKKLLIPVDLLGLAEQIRDSELVPTQHADTTAGEIQTTNSIRGSFDIIEVPDWTDTNNWALMADPAVNPAIWLIWLRGRRTPELFSAEDERSGAMFSNDEIRFKVRMFGFRFSSTYDTAPVSDWRPLFKANVS